MSGPGSEPRSGQPSRVPNQATRRVHMERLLFFQRTATATATATGVKKVPSAPSLLPTTLIRQRRRTPRCALDLRLGTNRSKRARLLLTLRLPESTPLSSYTSPCSPSGTRDQLPDGQSSRSSRSSWSPSFGPMCPRVDCPSQRLRCRCT